MQEALADELGHLGARWTDPHGGFFLWLTLPEAIDTEALFPHALAEGVAYIPGPAFSIGGRFGNALRLAFSAEPPERAREGVERLQAGDRGGSERERRWGSRYPAREERTMRSTATSTWRRTGAIAACAAACVFGVSACGSDDDDGGGGGGGGDGGGTVTVYSSMPLQGAARPQSEKLVNGIKLALQQAGNRAGDFKVEYKSLDDASPQAGSWTPEATSANARKVAQDDSAVGYIGEFNSGATAVSLPLLNDGGRGDGQPGQLGRRPDHRRGRAPSRASPTSTTRRASATTPASSPPTSCRAAAWRS